METGVCKTPLEKLLCEKETDINRESEWFLANRDHALEKITPLINTHLQELKKNPGEYLLTPSFFCSLRLTAFYRENSLLKILLDLLLLDLDLLDDVFGTVFVDNDAKYLLAASLYKQLDELKLIIENPSIEIAIRKALLEALAIGSAIGTINRTTVVDYFTNLCNRIINMELDDDLATCLVESSLDICPVEFSEEIRELFGLDLIETDHIKIDYLSYSLNIGIEKCLEVLSNTFHNFFDDPFCESDESTDFQNKNLTELFDKLSKVESQTKRNDPCSCNSGKKYKKCCMQSDTTLSSYSSTSVEEYSINFEPKLDPKIKALSQKDKKNLRNFPKLLTRNSPTALVKAQDMATRHQDIPVVHHNLHIAYRYCGNMRCAMKILKKLTKEFPNYLYGKLDYCHYLIRRGEYDKIPETLQNAKTLAQLYPECKEFHISEFLAFSFLSGRYLIATNKLKEAEVHIDIIKKFEPESDQLKLLEEEMHLKTAKITIENHFLKMKAPQ